MRRLFVWWRRVAE